MVIYLPAQAAEDAPVLDERLTPREIVREFSTNTSSDRPTPSVPSPSHCAIASGAKNSIRIWPMR